MTQGALRAEAAAELAGVEILVAPGTVIHCLLLHSLEGIAVAGTAFHIGVGSPERKAGMAVIKLLARRRKSLRGVTAAVIAMAIRTLRSIKVTVKSFPRFDQTFDRNVAGQTQVVRRALEVLVAAFAFTLELGMFGVQRPRRER